MNIQHIIAEALTEYDMTKPTIKYLLENTYQTGIKTTVDIKRSVFKFHDKHTDEIILETEVEFLGIFYDKFNVWSWAWAHIGLTNAENFLSKEILLYALKLTTDMSYLKSIITTSRGVIKDRTQVDINIALGASIIKQPYIYPWIYEIEGYSLTYYVILLNKEKLGELSKKLNLSAQGKV